MQQRSERMGRLQNTELPPTPDIRRDGSEENEIPGSCGHSTAAALLMRLAGSPGTGTAAMRFLV